MQGLWIAVSRPDKAKHHRESQTEKIPISAVYKTAGMGMESSDQCFLRLRWTSVMRSMGMPV